MKIEIVVKINWWSCYIGVLVIYFWCSVVLYYSICYVDNKVVDIII